MSNKDTEYKQYRQPAKSEFDNEANDYNVSINV